MKNAIKFIAKNISVSVISIILVFLAFVGSAYGFSKIVEATTITSQVPQVKTIEEFDKTTEQTALSPTTILKTQKLLPENISVRHIVPTQTVPTIPQSNINSNSTPALTPKYEKDEDTEDVHDDKPVLFVEEKSEKERK